MHDNKDQSSQQKIKKKLKRCQHTRKFRSLKKKLKKFSEIHNEDEQADLESNEPNTSKSWSPSLFMNKKCIPLNTHSNTDPTLFLSNYSTMSNKVFKEMLVILTRTKMDPNSYVQLFENDEILTFIRQLTHLINTAKYLQLQDEQWSYYYNLGLTEGIWTGRVSKKMALTNSMNYTYGRSKVLIEQRLKKYKKSLEKINNDIQTHFKTSSHSSPLLDQVVALVNELIHHDQYQLRIELERRRNMLKFDAKDHQLIQAFYQLKPRKSEVCSLISDIDLIAFVYI